ncbi:MAG: hypothetical protein KAJ12_04690, partial [Bacteroidetes bacterium]|nr:hypothetical protein [Bacteroidota bacterium]
TRAFYARVLRSKLRVVLIGGSPSPDVSAIRQTLAEDKNMTIWSFTERRSTGWYGGNLTASAIDSADCFIFVGFPTPSTPGAVITRLSEALQRNSSPFLLVCSPQIDYRRLLSLSSAVPFTVELSSPAERLAYFQPADEQRSHYLTSLGVPDGITTWRRLPPIFATLTVYRPRPGSTILGHSRTGAGNSEPFMLARTVGRQKSLAILGHGIWRWRLMGQENPQTSRFFSRFLTSAVQWLSSREESRQVKVKPTSTFFHEGEAVVFQAQVYDATARPIDRARVTVEIRHGDDLREMDLKPLGNGRFEGEIRGLGEGDYTYHASAGSNGISIGDDTGNFTVGQTNLEFQETRMNSQLLRELAHLTSGRYITPAEIDSIEPALQQLPAFTPRSETSVLTLALWDWYYTLAALLLLLSMEWFLRKRSGML